MTIIDLILDFVQIPILMVLWSGSLVGCIYLGIAAYRKDKNSFFGITVQTIIGLVLMSFLAHSMIGKVPRFDTALEFISISWFILSPPFLGLIYSFFNKHAEVSK